MLRYIVNIFLNISFAKLWQNSASRFSVFFICVYQSMTTKLKHFLFLIIFISKYLFHLLAGFEVSLVSNELLTKC